MGNDNMRIFAFYFHFLIFGIAYLFTKNTYFHIYFVLFTFRSNASIC